MFGSIGVHGSCARSAGQKRMTDYNKREAAEAKRMGAKLHKNSGRGKIKKGDGTWKNFLVFLSSVFRSSVMQCLLPIILSYVEKDSFPNP